MTRISFDQELELLKATLEEMGNYVVDTIDKLFEAIEKRDSEIVDFIYKNDRTINDMEKSIESQCLSIITKQQPVARDLRTVSAALKVVTDLERIGDHASDIAELIIRNGDMDLSKYSKHILVMTSASKEMVHDAVDTFLTGNIKKANEVIKGDDMVDELFNRVKDDLIQTIRGNDEEVDVCIDVLMINKYLEKIADHAVNIAEWEIFKETGSINDVRLY
ncbi:MAG: phosphate signaling complex protein PhoU [Eubacteriales bacterium]